MFKSDTFKDKVILVTGGRSGIGFQIAKDFLQLGGKVIICSRKEDQLKTAAEELSAYGELSYKACDIRNTDEIQSLATMIKEKYKGLDILINNAGGQFPALAEYINDKGWNAVINNNLNGTFAMTREMANAFFIPQKQGVIVNIIAEVLRGFPGMAHTGAARAGVENLTKTLAQEWSDFNIRINCVAPGIIESSGLDNYPKQIQDMFEEAQKAIPLKRFGKVEDVSNAVTFLSSPMSAYITGVSLYVDGAQHLGFDKMGLANVLKSFMN
ncbi:SDR family oxidoreductase [Aquimarina sp. 2201CG14-23]|uniref:SDR family oxidoreductase n=1 Tax=Aquimarina mycalae TaxID=3040073 RepID=UPI0024781D2E|nr:SDR family oxidoreductase [Aquimarina sp. 2201CG14-23]MDH7447453.1 SDR family oxidoreductase [Aquimarina sp. 2201CG14-23]